MRGLENFTKICFVITDGRDTIRKPLVDPATNKLCPEEKRIIGKLNGCRIAKSGDLIVALQQAKTVLYVVDFSKSYESSRDAFGNFRAALNSPEELGEIARLSGGERIFVKNVREAGRAFEDIAEKIGKMYVIGFYASSACGWYDVYLEIGERKNGEFEVNEALTNRAGYRRRWYLECEKGKR